MGLFVAHQHPLAQVAAPTPEQLSSIRQLILNTYTGAEAARQGGLVWSAPSYLLLLEMAEQGVRLGGAAALAGATIRPRQTHPARPRGWPKLISVDAVWSKLTPPGPAGF